MVRLSFATLNIALCIKLAYGLLIQSLMSVSLCYMSIAAPCEIN